MNKKELKTWLKRKVRVTLSLMVVFFITGTIGYAGDPASNTPTVQELQKEIVKKNEELEKKNKEIEEKNKEIEKRFNSKAIIEGKGAKIGNLTTPDEKTEGIAIGQEATIDAQGGNGKHYSLAIGRKAHIGSNGYDFSSIALGDNANVLNGSGLQEWALSFDSNNWEVKGFLKPKVTEIHDTTKIPGGISIGTNTFARTGSIQIGSHTYSGLMGGIDVNNATNGEANIVNMTTIGTNSYQKAAMGTMLGAYNISTGDFDGTGGFNSFMYGSQNFGSSVFGTLNSIRSKGKNGHSGVANSIVGIANTTENANGSLVFGAGNIIKNSNENLNLTNTVSGSFKNVDDAVEKFQNVINKNKAGGATLAIGGANKADYTRQVSMIGTRNEVKGTSSKKIELVSVSGDNNLVENSRNNVAGKNFHVTGEGNILQGFNNINNDTRREVTKNNVVALGNDIEINTDDSVYLGKKSTESKAEKTLWNNKDKEEYKKMYKDYAGFNNIGGIVTVGNDTLTRVIQNVAPGLISPTSTDAINGSQLYNYIAKQYITIKDGKGNSKKIRLGDTLTLKGTTIDVTVKDPDNTSTTPAAPTPQPANDKPAEHTVTYETDTFEYKLRVKKVDKDKKTTITTTLIEGADGKLYTQKFLDENEYKNNKWVKKGTDTDSENVSENQHKKTDENVVLSTKHGNIITNVADGTEKNDAVNFGQLKDVITKVEKNTTDIQKLNEKMVEVEKKSDLALGGVANAVAMANLVQVNSYSDYSHNLSAAYGYYGGSHALAIGFSGVTKDRRLVYKLSGSVNNKGNLAVGVGAGVMLGNKEESMEHKDINVKELYEKMSKLEKENSEFREMFKKLGVIK